MSRRLKAPNTFVILAGFLMFVGGLTWVLPGGQYERIDDGERTVVVADSFTPVERVPQGLGAVLLAPIRGFVGAALIIGFVLIVGGAFGVVERTGAIDAVIHGLAHAEGALGRTIRRLWIPIFIVLFSLGGAVFGMGEELIPFILVFIPLSLALGYDRIVGVAVPFVASQSGFAGAFLNPFTLGIAQGIAGLTPFSGIGYRIVAWAIVTTTAIVFISLYARRVRRNPSSSPTFELDEEERHLHHLDSAEKVELTRGHLGVLAVFAAGMIVLCVGVMAWGWYIEELAAVFLAVAIAAGLVARMGAGRIADSFIDGAKSLIATALVIALARGVLTIAQDGRVIDTILHGLSGVVGGFHPVISAQLMFFVQTAINLFVPSGSGQAALTMPIMAPLADLVGVTRQTAVLAFQLGDGFTNMIIPTSGVTMGILTLAKIDWLRWARWMLPLQLIFTLVGLLLLIPPVLAGWE